MPKNRSSVSQDSDGEDLRSGALSLVSVTALSVGGVAPSAGFATSIGFVFLLVGNASWLTWLLASVGLMTCAYAASFLARRFTTTGGLYGLGAQAGGAAGGYFVGLGAAAVGVIAIPVLTIGSAIYFLAFFHRFGLQPTKFAYLVAYVLIISICGFLAYRDIRLSSRVLFSLEVISFSAIALLLIIALFTHHGPVVDHAQVSLKGSSVHTIFIAMAFAVYSLGGWDVAATLGKEARNPERAIPIAMIGTVVITGLLYVFGQYVVVRSFEGVRGFNLATAQAPLDNLASIVNLSWYAYIVDLGVAFSFFACAMAYFNVMPRYLFTMSRDGLLPRALGRSHRVHRTPWLGVVILTGFGLVVTVIPLLGSTAPLTLYGYIGTGSGYALIVAYGGTALVALIWAIRNHKASALIVSCSVVAVGFMGYALYNSFHPFPSGVFGGIAWAAISVMAFATVVFVVLNLRKSEALDRIRASKSAMTENDGSGESGTLRP